MSSLSNWTAVVIMKELYCSSNSASRSDIAISKSCRSIALATSFVSRTACMRGFLAILFSVIAMKHVGVSGVASRTALTASTPCNVPSILS